jgi:hypothetical protein
MKRITTEVSKNSIDPTASNPRSLTTVKASTAGTPNIQPQSAVIKKIKPTRVDKK